MKFSKKNAYTLLIAGLLLAACSSPEEKEAKYIKRGNALFDQGDYAKARIEYKNAIRIKPADAEPVYRIGLIDEAQGNLRGAFIDFGHAEEQNPKHRLVLLKLAEYYLAAQQYDDAQKRVDAVLADTPNDPEGHALRASLMIRHKDFAGAETEGRFALQQDPKNVPAYSVLAGLYAFQGDVPKANALIDEAIGKNPDALSLYLLKASIAERNHDDARLGDAYQSMFKLKPKERRFRSDLSNIYIKNNKIDDAEAVLREGVKVMPGDWDMKHQLVDFLAAHRGVDPAEKEIRSYMAASPDQEDLYGWLIDLYVRNNAVDKAVTFLNQIIDKNTFDKQGLNARTALARIKYIQGDKDGANQLCDIVLSKDKNNLEALFLKSSMAFDRGDYQLASDDLHIVLREKPHTREAMRLLGETLFAQSHVDLAIDQLNQLMELDPTNSAVRVRLAQLYHLNGDSKRAMDLLFLTTKTDPKYPVGWETTARIAIDLKDWATAQTAVDMLDTMATQHTLAAYLRGQILANTGKASTSVDEYKQVISADPSSSIAELALKSLVAAYKSQGHMDEAVKYIQTLKTTNPNTHTILGTCYLDMGKPDLALAEFDAAIAGKPTNQDAYLYRAKILLNARKQDDALKTLKDASTALPKDIRADLMLAEVLAKAGEYDQTVAIYEKLLAANPGLDAAANNMAEIIADEMYTDPAKLERGRQVAERFVASSNPLLLDTLAWIYYRQNKIQDAQTTMERVMKDGSKLPPQIHYHYGAILAKAGRKTEAKEELGLAIANGSVFSGSDDAKTLLQQLQ